MLFNVCTGAGGDQVSWKVNGQCAVYCSFEIYIYVYVGSQLKVSVECCSSAL